MTMTMMTTMATGVNSDDNDYSDGATTTTVTMMKTTMATVRLAMGYDASEARILLLLAIFEQLLCLQR